MEEPLNIQASWIEALSKMPKLDPSVVHPSAMIACLCGKLVHTAECRTAYSGYVNYVVALCTDHAPYLTQHTRLICPRCRQIVMFIPPHKDPHGFVYERGATLHVERCPQCRPDLRLPDGGYRAPIVEKILFYKERGIPYPRDNEIL